MKIRNILLSIIALSIMLNTHATNAQFPNSPYWAAIGGLLKHMHTPPAQPVAKQTTFWQQTLAALGHHFSYAEFNKRCEEILEKADKLLALSILAGLTTYTLQTLTRPAIPVVLPTPAPDPAPVKPSETLASVAGNDEAKEALKDIQAYLQNPEEYTRLGAERPKGVLLVGPPGNGKTLLAKALAGETNCHFIHVTASDISSKWIGESAQNVKLLFEKARKQTPCIIFFDELDALGSARSSQGSNASIEHNKTVCELLEHIDGYSTGSDPIIIIGATNHAQDLDPALKRRFDQEIQVPNPTRKDRKEILSIHTKDKKMAPDVDIDAIARSTIGFSGADLAKLIKHAARIATRAQKEVIEMADILEAWQTKILGGAINKTMDLTHEDLKKTAYHEAGHALIALLTPEHSDPLYMVTIEPRGNTLGICATIPDREQYSQSQEELYTVITKCMGGRAAEELQFKQLYTGATNDIEKATDIARTMIRTFGMSKLGPIQYGASHTHSPAFQEKIDTQVQHILNTCYEKARALLTANKDKLDTLAARLLEKKTLQAAEIYTLLGIEPRACPQLIAQPTESNTGEPDLGTA